jgi:hypothetical protein
MQRYTVNQFDASTFQVIDRLEQREICVCCNYDEQEDAKARADKLAQLLNEAETKKPPLSA